MSDKQLHIPFTKDELQVIAELLIREEAEDVWTESYSRLLYTAKCKAMNAIPKPEYNSEEVSLKDKNPWISVEKELPPCDSLYLISYEDNQPKEAPLCYAKYDGFGFFHDENEYLCPKTWKHIIIKIKKYGKQK